MITQKTVANYLLKAQLHRKSLLITFSEIQRISLSASFA